MQMISHIRALWMRQWHVVKGSLLDMILNNVLLRPALFSANQGYFIPLSAFPHDAARRGTEMLLGIVLFQAFVFAHVALVELVKDCEETGMLRYHVMATSYGALFWSRLTFYVAQTYMGLIPFLPMARLFLGDRFLTEKVSWLGVMGFLFLMTTTVVSYILCLVCGIAALRSVRYAWTCGVEPFLWLSGMWAAPYAMAQSGVPGIPWLVTLNPFAYATDGLRQLFFHEQRFQPMGTCCLVLVGSTFVFTLVAYFLFKRRLQVV